MKKLILILLLALPAVAVAPEVDHTFSWPTLQLGPAVPDGKAQLVSGGPREEYGSNDESGTIVLWTGENCCPSNSYGPMQVMLVTYGVPYQNLQRPIITPVSNDAAELEGDNFVYVNQVTASRLYFEIVVRKGGLKPLKTYAWNYVVPYSRAK